MNHNNYREPTEKEKVLDEITFEWQSRKFDEIYQEIKLENPLEETKLPKQDKVDNPIMREKMLKAERELNETLKQIAEERRTTYENFRTNKPNR